MAYIGNNKIVSKGMFTENAQLRGVIDGTITDLVIPEGTTKIREYAFQWCSKLKSVTIPDSVTFIGNRAFNKCTPLTRVVFPKSIETIDDCAFDNCTKCLEFDFSTHKQIPQLRTSGVFPKNTGMKILVPSALYEQWIKSEYWSDYKDYIVPTTTKSAPDESKFSVFVNASTLKWVTGLSGIGIGKTELRSDGNVSYLRLYGDGSSPEAYATVPNIEGKTTGKYLVFAYRIPTSNVEKTSWVQIYANTTGDKHTGKGDLIGLSVKQDGNWHVVAIDLEEAIATSSNVINGTYTSKFKPNADGTYTIGKLRLDWFNQLTSTTSYVDVAYVGMCDTLENARSADPDYTGVEFVADDFISKLGSNQAVKNTVNKIEYATITIKTAASGENYVYLVNDTNIQPNTSKYVGIMYRNAPGGNSEVWIGSEQVEKIRGTAIYDTFSGWHFAVISFGDVYKDSVCRMLRYDCFNNLNPNTQYSIDVAFVKFFASTDEANAFYQSYKTKYSI